MRVILNREKMRRNIFLCGELACKKKVGLSFMIKGFFLKDKFIENEFRRQKTYTTIEKEGFIKYDKLAIADLLEKREGESEGFFIKNKGNGEYAILNCYCSSNKLPTEKELKKAIDFLHEYSYKVSAGGSVIAFYKNNDYDEIRIGEGVLTGYSTVKDKRFFSCENPYTLEMEIEKEKEDYFLVRHGFFELGGFTDTRAKFVNTELSGFEKDKEKNGKIVVHPDYYTLARIYERGINVEYI